MADLGVEHLRVEAEGAIGRIVLDRPEKLNPLSTEVLLGLEAAARWLDDRLEVQAVLVRGEGRAFCAGADVAAFASAPDDGLDVRDRADAGRRMADALEAMRAVTVAAVHGHCIGGAVVLVASCDIRVAADTTSFAVPELDLGIPLTWGGIPRLVREIGAPATRDLVMSCRTFDAQEALRLGLVQRVVPESALLRESDSLVRSMCEKSASVLRTTKRQIDAVTSQMVGRDRGHLDADSLVAALQDQSSRDAAAAYLLRLSGEFPA